jgi:hypothetical protein
MIYRCFLPWMRRGGMSPGISKIGNTLSWKKDELKLAPELPETVNLYLRRGDKE